MIICSCNCVSKSMIIDLVRGGYDTLDKLSQVSFAGADCGGCIESLLEIIEEEKCNDISYQIKIWLFDIEATSHGIVYSKFPITKGIVL